VSAWRSLVRPGVPIGSSEAVHGISQTDLEACRVCGRPEAAHHADQAGMCDFSPWPMFSNLARNLAHGYSNCHFAGKNVRFDLRVLAAEFARHRVPWSYAGAFVLDVDRLEALLEPRDLSSLYRRRLGREPDGAHRADNDVRMTVELLVDQLQKSNGVFPLDLAAIHELSWPGWLDSEGKIRRGKDGVVALTFGKHAGVDIRRVPADYWSWVRKNDFSAEFKDLVSRIQAGTL
jgi:DNA polymerase III epsilon subunit-like protein